MNRLRLSASGIIGLVALLGAAHGSDGCNTPFCG
jgi:hypothetical protein